MSVKSIAISAAVAALIMSPGRASAETFVSPFVGITFGGDTVDNKIGFGGQVTFMGRGAGLELEGSITPDFFEGVDLTTFSASYIAGGDAQAGGVKPFGLVGITLLHTSIEGFEAQNDWAVNLAGGIVALFNDTIGIRGELRYLRRIAGGSDLPGVPTVDTFDFYRAGIGVVFRF